MDIILADTHGPILGKAQATPNLSLLYLAAYAKQFHPDLKFHYIPQNRNYLANLDVTSCYRKRTSTLIGPCLPTL